MRQTTIRGGIVGCGAVVTTTHLPAWRRVGDAEIVAVCDQREEVARVVARRWGVPAAYGDLSQMLAKEKLDFVDICTPPLTHYQLTIQAIEAGLHVIVEKPMATSLNEADEMVAAAKEHGIKLCVVHNILFSPVVQKAKSLVDRGVIGKLLAVDIHILEPPERFLAQRDHWCHHLPGGVFNEVEPHSVYLASAFLGKIHTVKAIVRKQSEFPWATADELKVLLEAEKGLGALTVSCNSPRDSKTLDIFGTKGSVHLDYLAQIIIRRRHRSLQLHGMILDRLDLISPVITAAATGVVSQLQRQKRSRLGHRVIIQKFVESLLNNTDPPVTGEDDRETIRILEEIWKQIG